MAKRRTAVDEFMAVEDMSTFYGLTLDDEQKAYIKTIEEKPITFVDAMAGTGKTTLAVGMANILVKRGNYDKIIYVRCPCEEQTQGYLPGTVTEKSAVYFEALYDAMITCGINPYTSLADSEDSIATCASYHYIFPITDTFTRGVNFSRAVVIVDEAQNFTFAKLKRVLTRVKDDCKVIVIGHSGQIDLYNELDSGFAPYLGWARKFSKLCGVCMLTTNYRGEISKWADMAMDIRMYHCVEEENGEDTA